MSTSSSRPLGKLTVEAAGGDRRGPDKIGSATDGVSELSHPAAAVMKAPVMHLWAFCRLPKFHGIHQVKLGSNFRKSQVRITTHACTLQLPFAWLPAGFCLHSMVMRTLLP